MVSQVTKYSAHIGIDWADKKHDYCIQGGKQSNREFGILTHSPDKINDGFNRYTSDLVVN